jgi:hypothetical protein
LAALGQPSPLQLEYARQPAGSIASCQYRGDGGVVITIPPIVQRTLGKVVLAISGAGVVVGLALFGLADWAIVSWFPLLALPAGLILFPSISSIVVTLWMGLRWTIIEADPEGLRLELRGRLWTRRWFVPRDRIGRLRLRGCIHVLDPHGRRLRRIDATNGAEEMWVLEVLTRALAIPPPLPPQHA